MQCIGHRGAKGHAPENTLKSFATAIALGAHAVELDVQQVENRLVVIHDDNVDRTTNGTGALHEYSFEGLRNLDAGGGEMVPTLDEVLEHIAQRIVVNIEIKGPEIADHVVDAVRAWIGQGWPVNHFLLSSFDHGQLVRARELDSQLLLGVLVDESVEAGMQTARSIDACALIPSRELVSREIVCHAHDADLRLIVFTVNDPGEIEKLGNMGVDGLISDYPDRVIARWPSDDAPRTWMARDKK